MAGNLGVVMVMSTRVSRIYQEDAVATMETFPTQVSATYRSTNSVTSTQSLTHTLQETDATIDVTAGYDELVTRNSTRFKLGSRTYVERDGVIYHSIDPLNNAGIAAGSMEYSTGKVTLTDWLVGDANSISLQSLVTQTNDKSINFVAFRIPITPVRVGSVQIIATTIDGERLEINAPATGIINTSKVSGKVDYEFGVVALEFGAILKITSDNQAAIEAEDWYDPDMVFTVSGSSYIRKPIWVLPDSITYNAVGYSYLPLSADILQLDPVRLPSDGKVPIFRQSELVILTCNRKVQIPNPSAGVSFQVGEVRLSTAQLVDNEGTYLNTDDYTFNLDSGPVVCGEGFVMGDLVEPIFAEIRYQDMALATDVQINGMMAMSRTMTHSYSVDETIVSSALIINDMQARAFNVFSQGVWNNVWADERNAPAISSQYNTAINPIVVSNIGAIEQRWALVFITTDTYRIIGDTVGIIAQGNITADCSPLNPANNKPYFTIKKEGWGAGWVAGNTLRFNTAAANYPLWIARTVLQGQETSDDNLFIIQTRGDIDRP